MTNDRSEVLGKLIDQIKVIWFSKCMQSVGVLRAMTTAGNRPRTVISR